MRNVTCIHGHGISIGGVRHGTVSNVTFSNMTATGGNGDTQGVYSGGGLRVKSYPNSTGSVYDILYEDIVLDGVYLPLQLLGRYCPFPCNTPSGPQSVQYSNIVFRRIRGTGRRGTQANFDCSPYAPCKNITIDDVTLKSQSGSSAEVKCSNVQSIEFVGGSMPNSCTSKTMSEDTDSSKTTSPAKMLKFRSFELVAGLKHLDPEGKLVFIQSCDTVVLLRISRYASFCLTKLSIYIIFPCECPVYSYSISMHLQFQISP